MFKNFVILVSFYIIGSLLFQNPNNFNLIKNEARGIKNMVISGANYAKNTFHFATNPKGFIEDIEISEETWHNEK